jgi:hypothetical protein
MNLSRRNSTSSSHVRSFRSSRSVNRCCALEAFARRPCIATARPRSRQHRVCRCRRCRRAHGRLWVCDSGQEGEVRTHECPITPTLSWTPKAVRSSCTSCTARSIRSRELVRFVRSLVGPTGDPELVAKVAGQSAEVIPQAGPSVTQQDSRAFALSVVHSDTPSLDPEHVFLHHSPEP